LELHKKHYSLGKKLNGRNGSTHYAANLSARLTIPLSLLGLRRRVIELGNAADQPCQIR
jgi:hypothetical protein